MHDDAGQSLIAKLLDVYTPGFLTKSLNTPVDRCWKNEHIQRWRSGDTRMQPSDRDIEQLQSLLPRPINHNEPDFRFIDLFAGIGGIRRGFDEAGGLCVFTSEWNKYAVRTYKANHYCDPLEHLFNEDIRHVTLSADESANGGQASEHIDRQIPDHDVLLAGFPCQPFSIAGVSKKNSLGRAHGFECKTQGTLFFDVAQIINTKRPAAFVLENVKNLKSHDQGRTFRTILETLDELGYEVADMHHQGNRDPKVIDASIFLPQHRERIVLVGFSRDLQVHSGFTLQAITQHAPERIPDFGDLLEPEEAVDPKYLLSPKLWQYLYDYANKHKAKGNGFGFGLTGYKDIARTLSARYYKDGSEILVDRGWDRAVGFDDLINLGNRPRRLTPAECARLMGFDAPGESAFRIPVSDTQAYKQFGNSVAVPVFRAIASMMKPRILAAKQNLARKSPAAA